MEDDTKLNISLTALGASQDALWGTAKVAAAAAGSVGGALAAEAIKSVAAKSFAGLDVGVSALQGYRDNGVVGATIGVANATPGALFGVLLGDMAAMAIVGSVSGSEFPVAGNIAGALVGAFVGLLTSTATRGVIEAAERQIAGLGIDLSKVDGRTEPDTFSPQFSTDSKTNTQIATRVIVDPSTGELIPVTTTVIGIGQSHDPNAALYVGNMLISTQN